MSNKKDFFYSEEKFPEILDDGNAMDTFLVSRIHTTRQIEEGLIVVGLSKRSINNLLLEMSSNQGGLSFIVKQNGNAYYSKDESNSENIELVKLLKNQVQNNSNSMGSFNYSYKGETYSVVFDSYEKNGWKYVSAIPLSHKFAPVKKISQFLLWVNLLAILVSIIISSALSRKIYKPVGQLTEYIRRGIGGSEANIQDSDEFKYIRTSVDHINDERQQLKGYIEKNRTILRNGLLLQLIQGHLHNYSEEELQETMGRMGWKLTGQIYVAVFFKLFLPNSEEGAFSHGDEHLATYAAANIIEEVGEGFSGVIGVVNFHNLSIAMLLEIPENESHNIRERLECQCEEILERLYGYLGMQVTTGIGMIVNKIHKLPDSLEAAVHSIRYRDVNREREIIFSEDLLHHLEKEFQYPIELENEILYDIRMGMFKEASEKIGMLADGLKKQSGMEFFIQQGMLHLLGSILHVMIQTGTDVNRLYSGNNLYEQLCTIKKAEEMVIWFREKVILPYEKEILETQDIKFKAMIVKIQKYVEDNYMKDISLDICADEVGIPAKRLSVIFARIMGINFIDYVTDIRMSKAKEMLMELDLNINEIAFMVGYQPQYFNKLFKKREGITPGEYRQAGRAKA